MELFKPRKLINETIVNPRLAASKILSFKLDESHIVQAGFFVAICSTILTYFFLKLLSRQVTDVELNNNLVLEELFTYMMSIQPIFFTANQMLQMLLFSALITLGGKVFGGLGKFFDAFLCVIWIEFVLLILKLFQIILLPISLILAFAILIPGVIWSLWAFAAMAAAIHGFQSTILTFFVGLGLSLLILTLFNIVY